MSEHPARLHSGRVVTLTSIGGSLLSILLVLVSPAWTASPPIVAPRAAVATLDAAPPVLASSHDRVANTRRCTDGQPAVVESSEGSTFEYELVGIALDWSREPVADCGRRFSAIAPRPGSGTCADPFLARGPPRV